MSRALGVGNTKLLKVGLRIGASSELCEMAGKPKGIGETYPHGIVIVEF